jgi:signal peptide peptidase SppA
VSPVLLQTHDWLIEPDAYRAMIAAAEEARGRDTSKLTKPANPLLTVEDGIASVSIEGPILRKPDIFARIFMGATGSEEIHAALREAGERADVRAVILDIDSPGGTVAGTPELGAAVAALNGQKPVYAFSSGLMCSAAYWIASQAKAIYATPSARVGSIGVVQTVIDNSARLHAEGIKVEVFAVGKYKSIGAPGTPLTDDQRDLIRGNLADTAREFHAAVLAQGRPIPPEAMEGQSFSGRQAEAFKLSTVVADRAEAVRRLRVFTGLVDTDTRAMSPALEDQLAEAVSQLETLRSDHQAQTELLTEESANVASLRAEVETLSAQADTLNARIDTLVGERDDARSQIEALNTQVAELQASQADFDAEVARVVASTGHTPPANVTPAGDNAPSATATIDELVAQYDQLVSDRKPEEAAKFFEQHLAQHFNR